MFAHRQSLTRPIVLAIALAVTFLACVIGGAGPATGPATAAATRPSRTKAEIEKLIDEAGKAPPAWWDATPLNFPQTLDLTWKQNGKGWQPQVNMGAYLWDVINPNPAKWHEGLKLVHHTYTLNKTDTDAQTKAGRTLAKMYTTMLCDYPRGAYWARKCGGSDISLAECYLRMGNPAMATELLKQMGSDQTRNGQAIKLWADLGELKTALAWAEASAKTGSSSAAFLAAGDACRRFEKIPDAITYYQKVLALPAGANRDDPNNKRRAQMSLDAIKLFDSLNLAKVPDGAYKAASNGYVGPVETTVTVKSGRIEKVEVTSHHEKQFYSSVEEVPARIIAKQSVKGIDMTTGATMTSEAIINGTAKALSAAQK